LLTTLCHCAQLSLCAMLVVQGGLPAWLLSDNVSMVVRSMDKSQLFSC